MNLNDLRSYWEGECRARVRPPEDGGLFRRFVRGAASGPDAAPLTLDDMQESLERLWEDVVIPPTTVVMALPTVRYMQVMSAIRKRIRKHPRYTNPRVKR